ncbi:MAG TPA: TolC family protein, partial [Rhodocyclaceae bacterium]|nr:TolC family protein [Rhodocyclaceae bacterium]
VPQARAGLLPSLSLNAQTNWNDLEVSNRAPTLAIQGRRQYNNNGYSLSLSQPLFRWQNWVAFEQGKLQEALAEVQFNQARQDLILRVAQAYFDVLFAEEALKSASALKTATEQQRALARQSFEVGTVTITDVHEAQSRFDLASAQEISAKSDVEVKRNALRQLIGREPDGLKPLRRGGG